MRYTLLFMTLAIAAFLAVAWDNINSIYSASGNVENDPFGSVFAIITEIGGMPGHIDDYWVWKSDGDMSTLLTYQFMHGSIFHIAGNMIMLLIFGLIIESRIQSRIIPLLLIAGVVGGVGHTAFSGQDIIGGMVYDFIVEKMPALEGFAKMAGLGAESEVVGLVGMSGAISGLVGAYLVFFPGVMNGIRILGFWLIGLNIIPMLFMGGNISYEAHIGGFIAGIIIAIILKRIESYGERRRMGPSSDEQPLRFGPRTTRQPI